jgi:hypothetical protein
MLDRFRWYLLGLLLVGMPYGTFLLAAGEHAAGPLPTLILKALTGWKEALVLVCGLAALVGRRFPKPLPFERWLLTFAVLGTVFGALIVHKPASIIFGFRYDFLPLAAYGIARASSVSRARLEQVIRWVLYSGVPVLAFGILQTVALPKDFLARFGYSDVVSVTGNPLPPYHLIGEGIVRAMATFPGPNSLAMYAAQLALLAGCAIAPKRWRYLYVVLALVALLLTFSRGHLLALAAALVIGLGMRYVPEQRRSAAVILAVFAVILASTLATIALGSHQEGATVLESLITHDTSTTIHADVRVEAWHKFQVKPFGSGLGTAGLATTNTSGTVFNPESWYLQILDELGGWGLLLALAAIAATLSELVRRFDRSDPLTVYFLLGFIELVIGCNFLPDWFEVGSLLWWILFGIYVSHVKENRPQEGGLGATQTSKAEPLLSKTK